MRLSDLSRDPKTTFFCRSHTPAGIIYTYRPVSIVNSSTGTDKAMCVNCHQFVLGNIDVSYCYRVPMDVESTPPLPLGSFTTGGGVLTP